MTPHLPTGLRRSSTTDTSGRRSLATNTLAQTSSLLTGYVLSFVSAPIILAGLGLRAFGIWALTGALAQYAALLDLGLARAIARFVALHEEQDDRTSVGQTMAVGLLAVVALGLILTP